MSVTKKVKVTNHGMINIPASLRKKFQITDGDYVLIQEDKDFLKIIPIESIESLQARSPYTAKDMLNLLEKSKKQELELEDQ
jgi:AbrB family looped-hinge helix DNA binding protein